MVITEWARWLFGTVLALVSLTCLVRLLTGRGRHDDVGQVVLGVGMVLMLTPWAVQLPKPLWLALFGAQAVGFVVLLARDSAPNRDNWESVHHLMSALAMVYMVVAMVGARPANPFGTMSPLAGAFGTYFLVYAAWSAVGVVRVAGLPGGGVLSQPRLVQGCRAAMGASMAYLLLAG